MILSDEEIKESHAPYPVFRDSHLEANAELRKARERIRELENENEGLRNCQEALYNELFPEEQEDEREVRWKWMTLRVEEMRDRISFLEDISSREFWAASRKIAEFQGRADRTEAKLRELVEVAEWRDECNDLFTDMNIDWINGRPEGPHIDSIYEISEEAEIAYEKALRRRRNDV